MRTELGKRTARYLYDSLAELARHIETAPRKWSVKQAETAVPSTDWDLNAGYADAVRMARDGWLEGARIAEHALNAFTPRDPAPALQTDFYGHMPHVARYCAGAPDSMIRHTPSPTMGSGRVLTLYVPVGANGSTQAQHMRNFGLGVAQYINQLEQQGTRVELYGCATSIIKGWRVTQCWRIKHADQPLDLAVLAFSIGHPAMLRRLEFALCERCDAPECSGYGSAARATMADLIDPPAGAYILNGMENAGTVARTPEAALAYVATEIEAAFGITNSGQE